MSLPNERATTIGVEYLSNLEAERDRYRHALESILALDDLHGADEKEVAREALDG